MIKYQLQNNKVMGKSQKSQKLWLLIMIALFAFILTFSGKSLYRSVIFPAMYSAKSDTSIEDWKFVWGETEDSIAGNISLWNKSTSQKPISKPFGSSYLRLNYILSALDNDAVLKITNDNSPIRVELGGKEIFNNGYGIKNFVGNNVNYIKLSKAISEQNLDIYIKVPFGFSFNAGLLSVTDTIQLQNFSNSYIGVVFGTVAVALGFICILMALMISIKSIKLKEMILLGLTLIICGIAFALNSFSYVSMLLSNQNFLKVQLLLDMLAVIFVNLNALSVYKKVDKYMICGLIVMLILTSSLILINDNIYIKVLLCTFAFAATVLMACVATQLYRCIKENLGLSKFVFVLYIYILLVFIYNFFPIIFGISAISRYIIMFAVTAFCLCMFAVFYKQTIYFNIKLPERNLQIEKDSVWINDITNIIANVFQQKTKNDFFIETAMGICKIIDRNLFQNDQGSAVREAIKRNVDLRISACVSIKTEENYQEIFNNGEIKDCDYSGIENRFIQDQRKIYIGISYIDFVFLSKQDISAIIHVENITDALCTNISNIVQAMYISISTAYDNLRLKKDMVLTQESVFVNLAQIVECKSNSTSQHLKIVSELVRILCEGLNFPPEKTKLVASAAMVHDIGKVAIPEYIIEKPGVLNDEEFNLIKGHIHYGYNILSQAPGEFMVVAAIIAQQHHEKYDGSGYMGLSGSSINIYARITAVADVFDALISKRSYKDAWDIEQVAKYINERSGTEFDPQIVGVFNRHINEFQEVKNRYL